MVTPPPTPLARGARKPWADRWLLDAFRRLGHPALERIGGLVTDTAWEALEQAGAAPGDVLDMACALSKKGAVDLTAPDRATAAFLDGALAVRYNVVPVRREGDTLVVATANPLDATLERDLEFATSQRVSIVVASPAVVRRAQTALYPPRVPTGPSAPFAWVLAGRQSRPLAAPTQGTAVEELDAVIGAALEQGASDVHVEPHNGGLLVRFRIDGILQDHRTLASDVAGYFISRLKVMAGLDIADRLRPQDGRAGVMFAGRHVDLRISTLPLGGSGEKAVVRVLDSAGTERDLEAVGFTASERARIERLLGASEGMILVTGPTGSGKTTTLYGALRRLHTRETNIVTVEDPIEYRLEGINQVQVHDRTGLSFATALRSILRQDPDVVLVGEIRDSETAAIALKAAMTGHLVLSTLHTNDAVSVIERLIDLGIESGSLGAALRGVVAQRLIRRVCPDCALPVELAELPADQQGLLAGRDTSRLRRAVGCARCRGTGYRGRMVVAEVLVVTPEVQRAIARGAPSAEIAEVARPGGLQSLWSAGLERVVSGDSTLHELLDNIASPLVLDEGKTQQDVDALLATLIPGRTALKAPARATSAKRVLLVDEDREARTAAREALVSAGYKVVEAAAGTQVLEYVRRLQPDLIVTEVALAGLDAVGLLRGLGEIRPPVILYTAQVDPELLEWVRQEGAAAVVPKADGPAALTAELGRQSA